MFKVDASLAREACVLSKFDLVSELVGEFPELQGIMGGYYTKLNGKPNEISDAIFDQYKPKGISDDMPKTKLGCMLSMVDNIDNLTGFFIINKKKFHDIYIFLGLTYSSFFKKISITIQMIISIII